MAVGVAVAVAGCSITDAPAAVEPEDDADTFCDAVARADDASDEVVRALASLSSIEPTELKRILDLTVSASADIAATAPPEIRADAERSWELAQINRDAFSSVDYIVADADLSPMRDVGQEAIVISERLDAFGVAECADESEAEPPTEPLAD